MAEKLEYPQIFRNDDGAEIIALNDIQAAAIEREGFSPAGKYVEKKPRQTKSEE